MSYLGTPYRFVYEAKYFTTGLTDVVAYVKKPDGNNAGPFLMTELLPFTGLYYFDFITSSSDVAGEYIALFMSPSEPNRSSSRASLSQVPNFDAALAHLEAAIGVLTNTTNSLAQIAVDLGNNSEQLNETAAEIAASVSNLSDLATTLVSAAVPPIILGGVKTKEEIKAIITVETRITGTVFEEEEIV